MNSIIWTTRETYLNLSYIEKLRYILKYFPCGLTMVEAIKKEKYVTAYFLKSKDRDSKQHSRLLLVNRRLHRPSQRH